MVVVSASYLVFYWQMVCLGAEVGLCAHTCVNNVIIINYYVTVLTVYIEKSHPYIYAKMTMLLPNISFMTLKFPVSRRHIDTKGFLFKTTEDPSRRKVMLKGYLELQKATPKTFLTKLQCVTSWNETVLINSSSTHSCLIYSLIVLIHTGHYFFVFV